MITFIKKPTYTVKQIKNKNSESIQNIRKGQYRMNAKRYFPEMNLATGIAVLLIILGHALPNEDADVFGRGLICFLHTFCSSFDMALFFILAGFSAYNNFIAGEPLRAQLAKRACKLLIPYVVYTILSAVLKLSLTVFSAPNTDTGALAAFLLGTAPGDRRWYLWTLFVIFALFLLLAKRIKHPAVFLICGGLLYIPCIFFPDFILSSLFRYSLFYAFGVWLRIDYTRAGRNFESGKLVLTSLFLLLVMTLFSDLTPLNYPITALLGSIVILGLSSRLSKSPNTPLFRFFDRLGSFGYDVYLLSYFVQLPIGVIFYTKLGWPYLAVSLMMFVFGLMLPYLIFSGLFRKAKWLNRLRIGN